MASLDELIANRKCLETNFVNEIINFKSDQAWSSVEHNKVGADVYFSIYTKIKSLREGIDIDSLEKLHIPVMKALIKRLEGRTVNPLSFIPPELKDLYRKAESEYRKERAPQEYSYP